MEKSIASTIYRTFTGLATEFIGVFLSFFESIFDFFF